MTVDLEDPETPDDPETLDDPQTIIDDLPPEERSILGRVLLALALMAGFYVLAIGIAAFMVWLPFAAAMGHITFPWKLSGFLVAGAGLILWSIFPRPDRFVPPGPRLDEADHPRLFEVIQEVADRTYQDMPADVFLILDMNAFVAQRGGVMGIGSTRVMGIGLPLLQYLTVPELKAVLAHEFGHYHGGDTKVGPWIYKTRAAIGRTVQSLDAKAGFLALPFIEYSKLFLQVTHAVSRRQEYIADAMAARTMGAECFRDALLKIEVGHRGFQSYCDQELAPVIDAGYLAPVAGGFRRFMASYDVTKWLTEGLTMQIASDYANPYATHPPLPDRLEALGVSISPVLPKDDGPSSISLIDGIDVLERDIIGQRADPELGKRLRRIEWDEVPHLAMVPAWDKTARQHALELEGMTIGSLMDISKSPEGLRHRFGFPNDFPEDVLRNEIGTVLSRAMQAALAREGWKIETAPGESVLLTGPKGSLEPSQVVKDILFHKMDSAAWDDLCARLELSAISLAGGGEVDPEEDLEVLYSSGPMKIRKCEEKDAKRAEALIFRAFDTESAFSYPGFIGNDLTIGPFLWDMIRRNPAFESAPSPAVSQEFPAYQCPQRLKRIGWDRMMEGMIEVTYAKFTRDTISVVKAVLADRYPGAGLLVNTSARDAHLRRIPLGGLLEAPIFTMLYEDRRLFMQFSNATGKLIYLDEYAPLPGAVGH